MLTPPKIILALPTNFIVVSASPDARTTKAFDMSDGNIWAPEKTARQFEYGAEHKFSNAKEPMFLVHLSSEVAQYPGKNEFTIEKDLEASLSRMGMKNVKTRKVNWGKYPVLSVTGERPDGSPAFFA